MERIWLRLLQYSKKYRIAIVAVLIGVALSSLYWGHCRHDAWRKAALRDIAALEVLSDRAYGNEAGYATAEAVAERADTELSYASSPYSKDKADSANLHDVLSHIQAVNSAYQSLEDMGRNPHAYSSEDVHFLLEETNASRNDGTNLAEIQSRIEKNW
jgi:hypothetical protein